MKRLPGTWLVVAVLLAVLLPLEQAHCLLMPIRARATPCGMSCAGETNHSCCAPAPTAQPRPVKAPACPCIQLPAGAISPVVVTVPPDVPGALVHATWASLVAAPPAAPAPVPAPDVGSPPLPIACDAHGLRAPPLSA